ncbi:RNA-binding domain-containing protein [Metschnikowia bicuspidata var. bicuspidata NRRL YB-4993]|uniref:RNA-binding domain-containing protein n=1 Tax=Metschnikowia bicuspidata var. bicuspidata NRRL YB-4993 TaxID=869754 RepID=A0A1A0H5I7_9ASCO|nr:RNA-binding domain-containing protein [Metschnikowia bicuspidata var. bicuspidata NRRL YB-4993]OBA19167.1 RNA-binding domain-containing protein [Metschnikowia bicuspidata var. bicuspidata NRRL YB-4993]
MSDDVPVSVQNSYPTENQEQASQDHGSDPQLSFETSDGHVQIQLTLQDMEEEAARLRELNARLDALQSAPLGEEETQKSEVDPKSVYVGNVDYGATPLELQQHFSTSGEVERVTIITNKQTGQPKGFAYLEFSLADEANKAVATLDGSKLRERELKVNLKRTNIPGFSASSRGAFRGWGRALMRGRGRGGFRGRGFLRGTPRFSPY